jgi:lipopolysaccharide transport system permease protein
MAGVIEGFRWSLLGTGEGLSSMFWVSAVVSLIVFSSGFAWFRRRERLFVDSLG